MNLPPRNFLAPRFLKMSLQTAALAALFALASTLPATAQPSGGPYGPVQKRYEVPQASHVFYVAPEAQAAASGASLEQPTSLANALAKATTGDAIILRGGTYRTGGLIFNQGITLQPYGDERPILKGSEVAKDWKAQPNGLWRTSWKKLFPAQPADWWRRERQGRITPLYVFNNDMVFLDGELLSAVGGEQDITEKTYYIDYEAGQVYLGTNPENHIVEITTQDSALIRTIADIKGRPNDRKGPVIRGLTFTQYAYRALEVEGTEPGAHLDPSHFGKEVVGTTLEDVTISYCSRVAGYFRGDKLVIRNSLISDCGTEGLYIIDSADVLLEKNIITRTNSAEKISGYYASAVKIFNQSYRVVCRDNLVIDNPYASGIWYDVGNVDGVVVDNWIERTNDGFFFEISKGAICAGNVFVNCNKGIRILNSSNVQVYQNTFFNSVAWIERTERSAAGDHFGWHPSAGPDVAEREGHVLVNNLMVADPFFSGPLLHTQQSGVLRERLKASQLKQVDGNVYVRRAQAQPQPLVVWSPVQNEKGLAEYASLKEFRNAQSSFEAGAREYPDYWGALFKSVELGRFQLSTEFPGATAGTALPAEIAELLKLKSGTKPFPGAYAPGF
jgi:parallel beta-helix repeat protein